ncbi:hypothetical protein BOTBODRAFT_32680 [Botryobasidium botryosum FD-172 SS1]|uniref:Tautomerase cis-CaaD-like domain-containing protein n=1 Tax=Botryobasidium botryosum (strain FD-172 SS1) TaxID=930990 RepID=A0A067MG91_BOTB1|nr:hypothetical protein BOTBODRAFT_32680 [Botryobasidium botryosum FD-172 SS1]
MPFYQVFYPASSLSSDTKAKLAEGITQAHSSIAGAPPDAVKVAFVSVAADDLYSSGKPEQAVIRVVGLIKGGRDANTRARLLAGLHAVFEQSAPSTVAAEISLIENRVEDTVRYAGAETQGKVKEWAAVAPPKRDL